MSEKKLCYALVYTGSNKKILARTILFYERLARVTNKEIFILTETKENYEKILKYVPEEKVYLLKNPEKYSFSKMKRYPNIYMKFCIYELSSLGYTHCIYLDSDMFINPDFVKFVKVYEKYIVDNIFGFAVQKYPQKDKAIHIAGCIIANIENDESDLFLSYDGRKPCVSADEDLIDEYSKEYLEKMQDVPGGLVTSSPYLKSCSLLFHTGGLMWATALASRTDKTDFERYKEICDELENNNEDSLF